MKAIICPSGNILYKSYYIYGLEQLLGRKNVLFSYAPFKELSLECKNGLNMFFVTIEENKYTKYFISCNDSYEICDEAYQWADVYGGVNVNWHLTAEKYKSKLVSLCPSFAIKCWSTSRTYMNAILNYSPSCGTLRHYLGRHHYMAIERVPLESYLDYASNDSRYAFFCSTLWYNDEWNKNDEGVNLARARFIRACKSVSELDFEGGLVPQSNHRSSEYKFSDCIYNGVSMPIWLSKTKSSCFVFNTPAFWNCHGWKLGEYLAMGKCIISTPLYNDLPYPLEHGKNIHFVENNEESIHDAISYILNNSKYKHRLERGAKQYWNDYGSPLSSLKLLGIKVQ